MSAEVEDSRGCPLCSRPIYSVRLAVSETDLPANTGSADAIRQLWSRLTCKGSDEVKSLTAIVDDADARLLESADELDLVRKKTAKAEATIAMLREALAEANRRTTEARIAASDEEPWVWSDDDDINETVEGFGHMMVVRITGGHLRALLRDGRAKAEPMETRRWWVDDGETFTEANDAASARLAANDAVTDAHASAVSDREWPEHVERISWGYTVTFGEATETEPDEDGATEWTVADMENDR